MKTLTLLISLTIICQGLWASNLDILTTNVFPASDTGTFDYYVDGIKVGTSYYEFLLQRVLTNSFQVETEGHSIEGQLKVEFKGPDNWEKVQYTVNGNQVDIANGGHEILISSGSREQSIPNESHGNLLEDMTPVLLQFIMQKHATQSSEIKYFQAYFVPALNIRGEIEFLGSTQMLIQSKTGIYYRYKVKLPPVYETEVVTDANKRICAIFYRAQNGVFIRSGFEELLGL